MFTAKLGSFFMAPLMAALSVFGGGHAIADSSTSATWNTQSHELASTKNSDNDNDNNDNNKDSKDNNGKKGLASEWNSEWNSWFHNKHKGGTSTTTPATTTPATPVITSMDPTSGTVGTSVTLTGSGFTQSSILYFGTGVGKNASTTIASDGTKITFNVPTSTGPYCKPGTPCPYYMSRLVTPGTYAVRVTTDKGTSNSINFTVTKATPPKTANPLSIEALDAPVALTAGTPGTWTVHVDTPDNFTGSLHYTVQWGDEVTSAPLARMMSAMISTSGTFSHTYYDAGTYTPVFTVTDDAGHSVTTSATVLVRAAAQ